MNTIEMIASIGFIGACAGCFVCWLIAVINMFRTVAHRKPGVPLFPHWSESPFNILFRPSRLTDRGLAARRWCFYGVIGFAACWVFGIILGLIGAITL